MIKNTKNFFQETVQKEKKEKHTIRIFCPLREYRKRG